MIMLAGVVAVGIFVGILLAIIIFKFANTDKKVKTKYDERQENIRNKGYVYSFYTMIAFETVFICLGIAQVTFPFAEYLLHLAAILAGCLVLCIYSICKDVYWGMNNNKKSYLIVFALLFLANLFPVVNAFLDGTIKTEGIDSLPIVNIMVVIWLAIIGCAFLVKKVTESKEEED